MCRLWASVAPNGSTAASHLCERMKSCVCSASTQGRADMAGPLHIAPGLPGSRIAVRRSRSTRDDAGPGQARGYMGHGIYNVIMRFLVTNDDGIDSPGLAILAEAAAELGAVSVLAPAKNWSVCGHRV